MPHRPGTPEGRSGFERGFTQTFGASFQQGSTAAARFAVAELQNNPELKLERLALLKLQRQKLEAELKPGSLAEQKAKADIKSTKALAGRRGARTGKTEDFILIGDAADSARRRLARGGDERTSGKDFETVLEEEIQLRFRGRQMLDKIRAQSKKGVKQVSPKSLKKVADVLNAIRAGSVTEEAGKRRIVEIRGESQ